jgi:hypothetical protein
MKYPHLAILTLLGISTLGATARAATLQTYTLQTYFDFTTYGTVAGGNTITSSAYGFSSTDATVKNDPSTTLTGSGLAITAGTNAGSTGVSMAGSTLAGYTGDFSLQIWYTSPATLANNTMLYGGTTTASQDGDLSGDQALFTGYGSPAATVGVRPISSNGAKYGSAMATGGAGAAASTLYDLVVTFDSTSKVFTAYLDGTSVGTMTVANGFNGLSALTNGFAIGGVQNPAFGDAAAAVNITSFMMYTGALDSSTVSSLHGLGANPNGDQFQSVGISAVPEPHVVALVTAGLFGMLIFFRRRSQMA